MQAQIHSKAKLALCKVDEFEATFAPLGEEGKKKAHTKHTRMDSHTKHHFLTAQRCDPALKQKKKSCHKAYVMAAVTLECSDAYAGISLAS